ncbi:TonB-dependent siderophore receptor [Peristeroidobacter soli]|uniref:TonB-dependent siderophore receptor n=1 Tax=Peristeroidobacter soli TaxID=2497877 RepID=UPI00101D8DC3|nr:TonB-dependent receptor [Peristeroidobacter soli]
MRLRRAVLGVLAAGLLTSSGSALANALNTVARLSIQPQSVASALLAFSDQAKVQVVSVGSEVRGRRSPGVEGELPAREALARLLMGTGLGFELINEQTIRVFVADPKDTSAPAQRAISFTQSSEVSSASTQSVASHESVDEVRLEVVTVFGRTEAETVREVPQSVMVFDKVFLENTGATDLFNVLRFVPSATNRRTQMGYLPQEFNIRGFYAAQTLNGTSRNTMIQPLDMQGVERVEVLMGPASVLYGSMEPGAVVNLVTKQPLDRFHWEFGAGLGSYDNYRVTADVGGPISEQARARLNFAYQDRESFLDSWSSNKVFVAPVVAFDLGERTQLLAEAQYSRERAPAGAYIGTPAAGLITPNPYGNYSRSFFIADPDEPGVGMDRKSGRVAAQLTHRFTDTLHGRAAVSYTYGDQNDGNMLSQGFLNNDYRTLRRYFFIARDSRSDDYAYHMDLSGEFATGPLQHKFSIGGEYVSERDDFRDGRGGFFTTSVDIFDPTYTATLPNPLLLNGSLLESETQGVFLQDRVSLFERLHLIGGVRYAKIRTSNTFTPAGGTPQRPTKVDQSAWPTLFGVLYDVSDSISIFANQSKSFMPRGGTTGSGAAFAPERSVQYELGTKFDIGRSGLNGSVALFQVEKPNVLTVDLANPGFQVPLGKVTSQGAEVSVQGYLRPNWSMYASYAYSDTEVESNSPALDGNRLSHAPGDTVSLMTRYDLQSGVLAGLGFSAAANYVADRYIDDGNMLLLPSYTRIDLGVYYTFSERTDFSLLLNNVTDEDVFSGSGPNLVELDLPRNVLARINFRM